MSVEDKVRQIVADVMGVPVDQVTLDSSPETIAAWDSLKHMRVMLAVEDEFNVSFTDEQIIEMLSVSKILAAVASSQ